MARYRHKARQRASVYPLTIRCRTWVEPRGITPAPQGAGVIVYLKEVIEMTDDETGTTGTFWLVTSPITSEEEENV